MEGGEGRQGGENDYERVRDEGGEGEERGDAYRGVRGEGG